MLSGEDTVLEVNGVCKRFGKSKRARLRLARRSLAAPLLGRSSADEPLASDEFWAVHDVSFSLRRGEAIGLIGLNGAGKSTLLSMLSGFVPPDRGSVRSVGRCVSFINLNSGLQLGLSGRDNVFVKGALLGHDHVYMQAHLQDIVDFAELGDFIDAPIETYSSGMRTRLAFAIAIHCDPNLLLIDEVLAVGDFRFKQKCLNRIQELRDQSSFVLVSHSMNDISRFCDKGLVLERGRVAFLGDVDEAIEHYLKDGVGDDVPVRQAAKREHEFDNPQRLRGVVHRLLNQQGEETTAFAQGDDIVLELSFELLSPCRKLVVGIPIHTPGGEVITAASTEGEQETFAAGESGSVSVALTIPNNRLVPGDYVVIVAIVDGPEYLYRRVAASLRITESGRPYWGRFNSQYNWRRLR